MLACFSSILGMLFVKLEIWQREMGNVERCISKKWPELYYEIHSPWYSSSLGVLVRQLSRSYARHSGWFAEIFSWVMSNRSLPMEIDFTLNAVSSCLA